MHMFGPSLMFLNDSAKRAELSCMACRLLHVAQASKAGMPIPERCFGSGIASENSNCYTNKSCETTPRGCEPLRAEPNGFRVHLLSRSDTVSVVALIPCTLLSQANCNACKEAQVNRLRSPGTRDLILLFFSDWCS